MDFATTSNGRVSMALRSDVQIRNSLRSLNGSHQFAFCIYPLPPDFEHGRRNYWDVADEYLQSAGSADRLTVEVRRLEVGGYRQYVIGRPTAGDPGPADEMIEWSDHRLWVRSSELFTADEAIPIYLHYWQHDATLPTGVELRPLDPTEQA